MVFWNFFYLLLQVISCFANPKRILHELLQGTIFSGRRQSEHDNGCDGGVSEINGDMEVMGSEKPELKEVSYLLQK